MVVQPYLFFNGRCEEALEFYKQALGAKVVHLSRFGDAPDPTMRPPGMDQKVMHATFLLGDAPIMASDGRCNGESRFEGFSLSLTPKDEAEAKRLFDGLANGGKVEMPLSKTFYSPCFGMVADRFGVSWMIYVHGEM